MSLGCQVSTGRTRQFTIRALALWIMRKKRITSNSKLRNISTLPTYWTNGRRKKRYEINFKFVADQVIMGISN